MSENSIEFSLSITEQRAVGFIPAWSLASLHLTGILSSSLCQTLNKETVGLILVIGLWLLILFIKLPIS